MYLTVEREKKKIIIMAATQYSDYYYNNPYQHIHHHHQSQPQNVYGYTGQYDCKNLNVNGADNYYNYNSPNNQWSPQYNAISSAHQHHQTQPHYQHQHLNMLSNQINGDYTNYSHHGYNNATPTKPISTDVQQHTSNERNQHQPNLNCNQYANTKNELYYGQQPAAPLSGKINEAIASSYPSSQLTKKRKIEASDDSPALRALLTKPVKRAKSSPYFYQSHGSVSPASSTDNYPTNYQLPSVPVVATAAEEQSVNLALYNRSTSKEGYEPSIDDIPQKSMALDGKYCAASLFAPSEATNSPMSSFMENISTPPTSPKDVNKNDESCDNLWNENGGL